MSAYDALLGTISQDGVELELGNGLNFTGAGVTATRNAATGKIDIAITGSGGGGGSGSGGMGFAFTYSTTTTDADPGAGTFRANNATLASATALYVDLTEFGGTGITAWLDSFDDYVGAVKGTVRLQSSSDSTKWIEYTLTAWTTATGYRKLTVAYKGGPGGILTTAGDTFLSFDAIGVAANLNNQALTNARTITYNSEVASTGATPAVDFTTGDIQKTTLSANAVPVYTPPAGVGTVLHHVVQNGTGGWTMSFPSPLVGTPPTMPTVPGTEAFYGYFWDGTNWHYANQSHASLSDLTAGDPHTQYVPVSGTRAFTGGVTITQAAVAAGTPKALTVTGGAHTASVASTKLVDVSLNLARTVQFATGALTEQNAVEVLPPTYAFVGASTISDSTSLMVNGSPIEGTNATQTRRWGVWVKAPGGAGDGGVRLDGFLRLGTGTTGVGTQPSTTGMMRVPYGFQLKTRNHDDAADLVVIDTGAGGSINNLVFGEANTSTTFLWGGTLSFFAGATERARIIGGGTPAFALSNMNEFRFDASGVTNPKIYMSDDATNGGTGQSFTYTGQGNTGTTGTGGQVVLKGTVGVTAEGEVSIQTAGGTKRLRSNATGLGFYTATPVAQQTVLGSRTSGAALADLLTKLTNVGIIIDGSGA